MANKTLVNTLSLTCRSLLTRPCSNVTNIKLNARRFSTSSASLTQKLANRVAIVTASTEGIGLAMAKRLAIDGAKVVISSRREENVKKALESCHAEGLKDVRGIVCHVGKEDDRQNLIDFTLKEFGKINCLVSNAAVNPYFGEFVEMSESQFDKIFEVNVKAAFMLTKSVVPHMKKNGEAGGSIVYISSIGAYAGLPFIGAYCVSKTALLGMTRNMSVELGRYNIRVNCVAPGIIKTEFSRLLWENESQNDSMIEHTSLKRIGRADEIGGMVSLLCSDDGSYITGENIAISGGIFTSL
ncbi:Dehydrogenase/reductase SDR family member 4 [Fragariocoptes setiger]|uniref:Dehydrogenase/reductase SDR family member 4 n=1 Tax=Fragariocoptes setiger TaxID=1670756 RepID=A0ABQ7SC28_9ACAR|nr:Dehydrogenase/reductase SDR family member 4 [Fragariocoptes setiger]